LPQGNAKKPATPATPPATPAAKPAEKPAASSEPKPVDSAKASDGTTYKVGDVVSHKGKQVRITKLYSNGQFEAEPAESEHSDSLTQSRTPDTISKWPSHLVIVRHAESERNIWKEIATAKGELVYGGQVRDMDVPLTSYGERQAVATGEGLVVEHKFDRVFVSPFKRTMETARLMIEQFPYAVEIIEDERLREIDFGVLDGLTKNGIADFHPEEKERRAKLGSIIIVRLRAKTTPTLRAG
jgi:Histidine phosphatase superfamily (branch 1)